MPRFSVASPTAARRSAGDDDKRGALATVADRALNVAEDVVYLLLSAILVVAAMVLLGHSAYELADGVDHGVVESVKAALDSLLLVFVLVELLGAVRATIRERKLVAEPFLLVGIIASIKEIVVTTVDATDSFGADDGKFADAMIAIGVLGGLVVVLSVATLLVRRKEREPTE